jgi:hypothetical protein
MKLFERVFLAALLLNLFAGCAFRRCEGSYDGLGASWREVRTNQAAMRMVIVHGMGGLGPIMPGYGDTFTRRLADRLHLTNGVTFTTNIPCSGISNILRISRWVPKDHRGELLVYELTWSAMTDGIKAMQFAGDERLKHHRLMINKNVKEIIDGGFGDAVLYLNPDYRSKLQAPILATIEHVDRDMSTNVADKVVFVTFSLGSKMTFDTVIDNTNNTAVQNLAKRAPDIIMLANQVPLLDLGMETNLSPAAITNKSSLNKFLKFIQKEQTAPKKGIEPVPPSSNPPPAVIHVVAATDPNDALSFPIEETDIPSAGSIGVEAANIYSHNVWLNNNFAFNIWRGFPSIGIPFFLESPVSAHIDYDRNRWLVKKLVNGFNKKRHADEAH